MREKPGFVCQMGVCVTFGLVKGFVRLGSNKSAAGPLLHAGISYHIFYGLLLNVAERTAPDTLHLDLSS
jgi:hypothetical protein